MSAPQGRLHNRVALVTGSSSGVGAAICNAYAAEGALLFCVDMYPSPRNKINSATGKADDFNNRISGQGTHEKIRQAGGEATFHKADVTKAQEVELAVRACVQKYGRLDIIVNNAGIAIESTHARPLRAHETSEDDFDRTMAINCKGESFDQLSMDVICLENVPPGSVRSMSIAETTVEPSLSPPAFIYRHIDAHDFILQSYGFRLSNTHASSNSRINLRRLY
jgi:NAD(P)-dependent dehydrogenase (short-subunit alcohol dehydrogenase family)